MKQRRGKHDKCDGSSVLDTGARSHRRLSDDDASRPTDVQTTTSRHVATTTTSTTRKASKAFQKHKNDAPTGGMQALLPSVIGLAILVCGVMAKLGFRGRASVCGIDLGTTNSVVCVQAQTTSIPNKQQAETEEKWIECISDPATGSPVIPSVVSFLEASERKVGPSSKVPSALNPHPSHVIVGQAAKRRIDSHPHHTLYHAKRVLGRPFDDPAVAALAAEVEFGVERSMVNGMVNGVVGPNDDHSVAFRVPDTHIAITPQMVGSYVIHHLVRMTETVLGHANVKSAIICVPAKFNAHQRQETVAAVQAAGLKVTRIVEEPTAAALAYGLHRKPNVNYILVYDFGGGTLDISLLHVSDGFVDVMGSDGDDRLGGTDFDVAIAHHLLLNPIGELDDAIDNLDGDQLSRSGQVVVDDVGRILHQIQSKQSFTTDLEDVLSAKCPVLNETPLCSISSFHTLGEHLKIQLSDVYTTEQESTVSAQCLGIPDKLAQSDNIDWTVDMLCSSLRPVSLVLTSSEFDSVVQPLLDRSIVPVVRLLRDLDLTEADIDEIVMVGGTTRMPHIRQLVQAAFPQSQLNTRIDPDITVAYGAASVID
jgi:molecular chaperone DnaK (HSP70)